MFLRLTDLDGDLVIIPIWKVRFIGVRRLMKKAFTCIHLDDSSWLGGTYNIYVQETISEVSLQLCHLETKSLIVKLLNNEKENNEEKQQ